MNRFTPPCLGLVLAVVALAASPSLTLAYQGFGAATPGGSGRPVYRVTNLHDSGPGSLRDAVSQGNRTVIFDVGGEIFLSSEITVRSAFLTIDGFTAPTPGITLKNHGLIIRGSGGHDVIVRNIRIRNASQDGIWVTDVIVCKGSASDADCGGDTTNISRAYVSGNQSADGTNLNTRGTETSPFSAPVVDETLLRTSRHDWAGSPGQGLKAAAKEGRFEDEGGRVRKDGSRFWANVIITALRDKAGNLFGCGKATRDLTECKQTEETVDMTGDDD